jgi:hypothetical protein
MSIGRLRKFITNLQLLFISLSQYPFNNILRYANSEVAYCCPNTNLCIIFNFETTTIKQPSASMNPANQLSSKLGLNPLSKRDIFNLFFRLKFASQIANLSFFLFK